MHLDQEKLLDNILISRRKFYEEVLFDNSFLSLAIELANKIKSTHKNNGKIILLGNGGSHAQASHLSTELVIRFKENSLRPSIPSIVLSSDPSVLTACGNDFSFDEIFSRQIASLVNSNDCLIAFSTSGKSKNIVKSLKESTKFLDKESIYLITGQPQFNYNEIPIKLIKCPSQGNTETYQEFHLLFVHILCNVLESIY